MPVSLSDGLWVDNGVDAGEFRKALGVSLVVPGDATGVVPRAGRLAGPGAPLAVTPTAPASMAVRVNAGKGHTFRSATYGGTLGIGPDGVATVPIPAAPASGSQWHRVYLLQRDTNAPASDTAAGAVIDLVSGLPASSPTAPPLPAGALLLADVVLPAGALTVLATHITDRPTYTAPRGGILPVANQIERVALQTAGLVYPTLEVLELDTGRRLWHDGARFRYEGDSVLVTDTAARDTLTAYPGLKAWDNSGNAWRYNGTAWADPAVPMSGEYFGPTNGVSSGVLTVMGAMTARRQSGGLSVAAAPLAAGQLALPAGEWLLSWSLSSPTTFSGRSFMNLVGEDNLANDRRPIGATGETDTGATFLFSLAAATTLTLQFLGSMTSGTYNANHTIRVARLGPAT